MKIAIDTLIAEIQPGSLSWEPPSLLGIDGQGAPIRAPFWTCRLGFSRLTVVQYEAWYEAWGEGTLHAVTLPHPASGVVTSYQCYVRDFTPRLDIRADCPATMGVDVTLTRIRVA